MVPTNHLSRDIFSKVVRIQSVEGVTACLLLFSVVYRFC